MSIIIRLQNLPLTANAEDIRRFFDNLVIPDGGVHIIGGEHGDAFIVFGSDEDARLAMMKDGGTIQNIKVKLLLSSRVEMQKVIDTAKQQALTSQTLMQTLAAASQFDPNMLSMLPVLRNLPGFSAMSAMPAVPSVPVVPILPAMTATPMPVPTPVPPPKLITDLKGTAPMVANQPKEIRTYGDKKDDVKMPSRSPSRSRSRSRDRRNVRDRYKRDRSRDRKYRRDRSRSKTRDKNGSRSCSRDRYRKRSRSRDRKSRDQIRDRDYNHRANDRRRDSDAKKPGDGKETPPTKVAEPMAIINLDLDPQFKSIPEAPTIKGEKALNMPTSRLADESKLSFKMFNVSAKGNRNAEGQPAQTTVAAAKSQAETKSNVQPPEGSAPPAASDPNVMNWWTGMIRPPMMPSWMIPPAKPDGASNPEKNSKDANNQTPVPPMPFGMYPFGQGFPGAAGSMYPYAGAFPGATVPPALPAGVQFPPAPNIMPAASNSSLPNWMPTGSNSSVPNSMPVGYPSVPVPAPNTNNERKAGDEVEESKPNAENESDSFGRQRRRPGRSFDEYSTPDGRNSRNYNDREDDRRDRRSRFDNTYDSRKYGSSSNSYDDEDSRSSRTSQEDRRHPSDRRYHNERQHPDDLNTEDSYPRRNPYRRDYSRIDDHESRFPSHNSGGRLNHIYNSNVQSSTCVDLQNVPLTATVADVKTFLAPLPLFESRIKFQSENADGRSRNVFVKLINVNQKEQALQQTGFIFGCRVRVAELSEAKYEAADKVAPVVVVDQPHMKISFIPKRARVEDVKAAFADKPEELLLTKVKDRESLVAYVRFADAKAVQLALKDKHNIMICESRVKLEAIGEEEFAKQKCEMSDVNGRDANLVGNDVEDDDRLSKRMRIEDRTENTSEERSQCSLSANEEAELLNQSQQATCVLLKNLPPEVTDKEIVEFFADVPVLPAHIHIMFSADYKQTGESYCEFRSESDAAMALHKHQCRLRDRTISVVTVPKEEVEEAIGVPSLTPLIPTDDTNGPLTERSKLTLPSRQLLTPPGPSTKPTSVENFGKPGCVVALENVPFRAEVGDVIKFFGYFDIVKENVIRRFNERGMPTGDFRVCLRTPAEAQEAAGILDGRKIFSRFVSVKVI